jgi:hypothetical protein
VAHAGVRLDADQEVQPDLRAGPRQLGAAEAAVGQHDDLEPARQQRLEQAQQPLLQVVLALEKLPLRVAGPQQRHRAAAEDGGGHQRVEVLDLDPVQGHHQGPLAVAAGQPGDQAGHAVADRDAAVGAEAPGALDPVLAQGLPAHQPAQRGEADAAGAAGGGDQLGEGFRLALAQRGAY